MIYIDLSSFAPDAAWQQQAYLLTEQLIATTDKQEFIEANSGFWGQIKDDLLKLSYNKCWFSEELVGGSAYQVEHFRPKNAVTRTDFKKIIKGLKEAQRKDWTSTTKYRGEGYWWLAFNHKNFRIIEGLFNSKKSTRFPLKEGSKIVYNHTDDIITEENILLDPTKRGDPDLLTFDSSGKVLPKHKDVKTDEYIRAFISIHIYGLNDYPIIIGKRTSKWEDCVKAVQRANDKFSEMEVNTDDENRFRNLYDEFKNFVEKDIKPAIAPQSEFSAVASACVRSYPYEWINEYVFTDNNNDLEG